MQLKLTPQQEAVVNHAHGPALVFAVAGAGKTTALEYRIARLVRENVFAPDRILAAAYNKAAQVELERRLKAHPGCESVNVVTLHALGLQVIRKAYKQGLLPHLGEHSFEFKGMDEKLLNMTLDEARKLRVDYARELDTLDRKDFLTWVTAWKGNLDYPSLEDLPRTIRNTRLVQQAAAPAQRRWYLQLYELFECIRRESGILTYDDQIVGGWEVLVAHPEILQVFQRRYDCVIVDEFQDVNLAQYQILDMIVAPHKNYMVIGDDDQTIYEWRGANPRFLLEFEKCYRAKRYYMTENFRCQLGAVVLANAVIQRNRKRAPKALQLTQGVAGTAKIMRSAGRAAMGRAVVDQIRTLRSAGDCLRDIAILVRAKAQTPPVERALTDAGIPYEVVGSQPFYARWEIETLLAYCRLALLDKQMRAGKILSAAERVRLVDSWDKVYRHPKRYISNEVSQEILQQMEATSAPLTQVLEEFATSDRQWLRDKLDALIKVLRWLGEAFAPGSKERSPAKMVLQELDRRLGYIRYLEERSTISESGVDEAENVKQFIESAQDQGTLLEYLTSIAQLAKRQAHQQEEAAGELITIRTIHSAKGLEWPVVIIPSCDDGNLPHRKSPNEEEERRLLYVAITRAKRDLFIYYLNQHPSKFLKEVEGEKLLDAAATLQNALARSIDTWTVSDLITFAVTMPKLGLLDYFRTWHVWQPSQRAAIARTVTDFYRKLEDRQLTGKVKVVPDAVAYWRDLCNKPDGMVSETALIWIDGLEEWLHDQQPSSARQLTPGSPMRPAVQPVRTTVPSAVKPAIPVPTVRRTHFAKGESVVHRKHGKGVIMQVVTLNHKTWLNIKFGRDILQVAPEDPDLF